MNRTLPLAAAALLLAASATSQDVLAVKGGRVVTVSGPTIDDGVVLIENGRITRSPRPPTSRSRGPPR